jgi:hypothetical protein
MGKVITSQGLQDFIQKGTITHVPDHQEAKPAPAASAEPVAPAPGEPAAPAQASEAPKAPEAKEPLAAPDPDDKDDGLDALPEGSRRYVNKQLRLRKEAQEALADVENFAKNQYTRAHLAEQRAAELEEQLTAAKKPPEPPKPELLPPDIKAFTNEQGQIDWDKYTDAKAEYAGKKAVADYEAKQIADRLAAERLQLEARVAASVEKAKQAHPDFDAVLESMKGSAADLVPQFILNYIVESENSGEIQYFLLKNPAETQRIAKLSPIRGIAELGKLEDKLNKPAETAKPAPAAPVVPERGGAPPPIQPLNTSASGSVNVDPSKMSYKELRAYERERERNKKR